MKGWRARIKEFGSDSILTPILIGDFSRAYAIQHWGLDQDDIEWYELEKIG